MATHILVRVTFGVFFSLSVCVSGFHHVAAVFMQLFFEGQPCSQTSKRLKSFALPNVEILKCQSRNNLSSVPDAVFSCFASIYLHFRSLKAEHFVRVVVTLKLVIIALISVNITS